MYIGATPPGIVFNPFVIAHVTLPVASVGVVPIAVAAVLGHQMQGALSLNISVEGRDRLKH